MRSGARQPHQQRSSSRHWESARSSAQSRPRLRQPLRLSTESPVAAAASVANARLRRFPRPLASRAVRLGGTSSVRSPVQPFTVDNGHPFRHGKAVGYKKRQRDGKAAVSPESESRKRSPPRSVSRGAFGTARRIPALCVWLIKLSPIAPLRPDAANGVVCLRPAYVEPIAAQFAAFGRRSQCRLARTPRAAVGRGWPFGTEAGGGGPREWHWPGASRLGAWWVPGVLGEESRSELRCCKVQRAQHRVPGPCPAELHPHSRSAIANRSYRHRRL